MPIDQIILPLTCHANGIYGTTNTYPQPNSSDPALMTYRGFPIERYNSQQSAFSFFSPLREFISKAIAKIRNLCFFRRIDRPQSGGNPDVGRYLELRLEKVAFVSNIIKEFVKDIDSKQDNLTNFRRRSSGEQAHLDRLVSHSPEITMTSALYKKHPLAPDIDDIDGPGFDSGFSPAFLKEMQLLEARIVTELRHYGEGILKT
jgi:hypothetical protein